MQQGNETTTPNKFAIAAALQEIGLLIELKGAGHFRARAYRRAARAIADLTTDIGTMVRQHRLMEIKGIGAALAAQIKDLYSTGHSSLLVSLRAELPPGVLELSRILSLKQIEKLHRALGISSIPELKAAAEAGRIREVAGFGIKSEQRILTAIAAYEGRDERILLMHAMRLGQRITEHLETSRLAHVELAGSIRRWQETVSTIRIVAAATRAPSSLIEHFLRFPLITQVESKTRTNCTVKLIEGVRVYLTVATLNRYWVSLHHETGSKPYIEKLQAVAKEKHLNLTNKSLETLGRRRKQLTAESEADIFRYLEMQFIPPELREDAGEIEQALAGKLPEDLVTVADIKGMVHCHTNYSDGKNTIEEMALAAEAMGMRYITITDHSPTAFYAGGVKVDRLKRQWDEIARVQEKVRVKLLRGTESDILRDGALDYPDHILEQFDVIIASIHNRYKMDEDQMTRRLTVAMKNPFFKIWGHALGRLIQRRPPFACRVEEVLDVIAESRAAIEINGDPYRLDMEPRWVKEARKRGIRFVISTDAHSTRDFNNLKFGVGIARRAGVRSARGAQQLNHEQVSEQHPTAVRTASCEVSQPLNKSRR